MQYITQKKLNFRLLFDSSISSVAMANQQAVKATSGNRITIPQNPKQFGIYIELDTSLTREQQFDACRKMCAESGKALAALDRIRFFMSDLIMGSYKEEKAAVERIQQLMVTIHQLCNNNGYSQSVAMMHPIPSEPTTLPEYAPTFLSVYTDNLGDEELSDSQLSVMVTDRFQHYIAEKALREVAELSFYEAERKARNSLDAKKNEAARLEYVLKVIKRDVAIDNISCSTAHLLLAPQVHNPP